MLSDQRLPKNRRPRKRPVQERSQFTVEAILDAAIQVFEHHGYTGGTTARIAERAGVSIGSLYQYFPNKDAILVAVALRHLAEGDAVLTQVQATCTPDQALPELVRRIVDCMLVLHAQHPALHRMLFEQVALPDLVRRNVAEVEQKFAQQLAVLLQEHPEVTTANPLLTALFVVQIVETTTHRLVLHPPDGFTRAACVDELVGLIVGYLT